jgi:NAD-dependent SIR2 family protein deacetylase
MSDYEEDLIEDEVDDDATCECGQCGRPSAQQSYTWKDALISPTDAVEMLQSADAILVGAGAGASIESGINYADSAKFAKMFPGLVARGVASNFWEMIGYHDDEATSWAYLAQHILEMRFNTKPHDNYANLRRAIGDKPHFVLTSNVDGQFLHHFDAENLLTAQGDFAFLQCGSCRIRWPSKDTAEALASNVDHTTCRVTDTSLLPSCPKCGKRAQPHVNGGAWFVSEVNEPQWRRLEQFLTAHAGKRVVAIDIGSGFNTPGVVRMRLESIVARLPNAALIRLNAQQPHVPTKLAAQGKAFALPIGFGEFARHVPQE